MAPGHTRCRGFRISDAGDARTATSGIRRWLLAALVCAGVARSGIARGDELALAPAPAPAAFDNAVRGAVADGGIGTSMAGDTLMFEIGAQWTGLRSRPDRRWLLQWDALVAARGGYLGNEHPYLFLIGGHEIAWAELGHRFSAPRRWSPYAGVRLGNEVDLMKHPGLAWSDLDTINSVDRVGGTVAAGLIRADLGASFLGERRSLLLVAFIQEDLHAAETNTPAQAFAGGGIGARVDLAHSLAASAEASWGIAPTRRDSLREFTDRTMHVAAAIAVRRTFRNGMWASLSSFIERDSDHMVYFTTGNVYDTISAPRFGLSILYGLPLERFMK